MRVGDKVKAGDVIADGASIDFGELSLGQNLLVAFLPWNGYNFEDSILISERVVSEQRYASVHIIEEVAHARSTGHLGDEEITRDIPHQPDSALQNLDEEGIVRVGVEVHPGDILVGKVTPKGERQMSPEERLLQAVFGDKANDFKDTSLRMPPGGSGVVIDVKVFASEGSAQEREAQTGHRQTGAGRRSSTRRSCAATRKIKRLISSLRGRTPPTALPVLSRKGRAGRNRSGPTSSCCLTAAPKNRRAS